jgi:hypothetical protein
MNRPDFTGLVEALKGGSFKNVGFKPLKLGNFDGVQYRKVVDVWFTEMEDDYLHATKWTTVCCGICSFQSKGLCFNMVEDNEARGREDP